jgi:hypothetical protein
VVSRIVRLVCKVLIEPTAPTRRMSAAIDHRTRAQRIRTTLRPARIYHPSTAAVSALVSNTAAAPPWMPIAGIGPKPKISNGESGTSNTTPTQIATAGTNILPVPLITLASAFDSQTRTVPPNTTLEYSIAASSDPPRPPIAAYNGRPNVSSNAEKNNPKATLIRMAWRTKVSASSRRPLPRARAMADEIPPPMAPPEIICIIMKPGNTSAMPVSASVPRWDSHHVSISPVDACADMTRMFGQAMLISVGTIAPCSSLRVRGLII